LPKTTPTQIRQQLMKEKGLTTFKPDTKHRAKLRAVPKPTIDNRLKTPMMRYLELVHGEPIESMLLSGSLSVVAKRLDNEVDTSTLSKWIKRLKLRHSEDNLPKCEGCVRYGPACDSGICYILIELERFDLLPLKKEEMFNV